MTDNNAETPESITPVLLPQVGNDMEEGTLVKWLVAEGDRIDTGQIIFEVETDKASIEIEADNAGRVSRIVVPEGETVPIKTPVAYLGEDDDAVDQYIAKASAAEPAPEPAKPKEALPPKPAEPKEAPPPEPAEQKPASPHPAAAATGRVAVSPAARRIAAARGIDIAAVRTGSGPRGRILSTDLPAAGAAARGTAAPISPAGAAVGGEEITTELTKMRKAIARNLAASKQTVPHFYLRLTIDAGALMDFYRRHKAAFPLSVNDVIVKACGAALSEFPAFRSRIEDDVLIEQPRAAIGVAVGTDDGLRVPVIPDVDLLGLEELAAASRRIIAEAREGKLSAAAGVFTISNLGMFGVEEFSAIINPPQAAILAVGAIREDVIVEHGAIRPGRVCTLTLSCDHRVVDGVMAARFAARLKEILENPDILD